MLQKMIGGMISDSYCICSARVNGKKDKSHPQRPGGAGRSLPGGQWPKQRNRKELIGHG
jgi:hypothetical protein